MTQTKKRNEPTVQDEFRSSAHLTKAFADGCLVNIYTDYMMQTQLEGTAKLIEPLSKGLTFMLYNEPMYTKLEDRVIDHESGAHSPLTKEQQVKNMKFIRLWTILLGVRKSGVHHVNHHISTLLELLVSKLNKSLDNPKILNSILEKFRVDWINETDQRGMLFKEYTNIEIIRFLQQTCLDGIPSVGSKIALSSTWCHSIWRTEQWLVEFVDESDRFFIPFRTIRKIRTLICICPNEEGQNSEIFHYVTKENSEVSNADKKEIRHRKVEMLEEEDEDEEEDTFYEEEDDFEEDEETPYKTISINTVNPELDFEDEDDSDNF